MSVNRISPEDLMALSAYLDGALDPPDRSSLERRLATEPLLRAELESLRDTVNLVKSLPRLKAPRDFTLTSVMLAQMNGGQLSPSPKIIRPARFNRWQMASMATLAASILLVFIGLFAGFDGSTTKSSSEDRDVEAFNTGLVVGSENEEDGIPKSSPTPTLDLSDVIKTETTVAASSAPDTASAVETEEPNQASAVGDDTAENAGDQPPSVPEPGNDATGSGETVAETQRSPAPTANSPAAILPSNGQAGSAANSPTAETMAYTAPTASSMPSPAPTNVSATKVTDEFEPADNEEVPNQPAVEQEAAIGRTEIANSSNSSDKDESFEIKPLLVVGLAGIIASIMALVYTWWKR